MAANAIDIIDKLKKEAIERCRQRILEAKKREGCERQPKNRYGMTSALRSRYGL
ncbi:hypothetical protein Mtc_1281 [Methanocella conradii HZ254]|uniref:Uncharacterized protein n=1 Tax=Methanocella conradii (strain DSM 24694 / JCM 17849 / CGMCC 1.5162 / HZ254) TaxID=1041930 RepID=H8I9J0_METCZ|nr:hypothetical protein [Methanocella conradii]AFD00035.1 hypothetical protein Mtc_1281 [Methanocella conradii HZ254]MDI6896147.1 hypothetical protein [Methanocella conradii]